VLFAQFPVLMPETPSGQGAEEDFLLGKLVTERLLSLRKIVFSFLGG